MSGHAIQRLVRQSPRKMRLVVDLIRGKDVNEAYAILKFNKKLAAKQIAKTLKSAVANAEQKALKDNERFDPDALVVTKAIVNGGQPLKRFTAAAQGRATPIRKRTSHVEIHVDSKESNTIPEVSMMRLRRGSKMFTFPKIINDEKKIKISLF
jgi:large subunit ribosomal protein L22